MATGTTPPCQAPALDARRLAHELVHLRGATAGSSNEPLAAVVTALERLVDAHDLLRADEHAHQAALAQARTQVEQLQLQVAGLLEVARGLATGYLARPARAAAAPGAPDPSTVPAASGEPDHPPVLTARVLGPFQVEVNAETVENWPNCRARSIFEYLLLHRRQPVPKEQLMEALWPEADPDAQRNSLNVAVHRLRRLLARFDAQFAFVPLVDGCYSLNRELVVQTDADAYLEHARRAAALDAQGDHEGARAEYEGCRALYRQELLAQNRGDEWVRPMRQQWRDRHLVALRWLSSHALGVGEFAECIQVCSEILAIDPCHEQAHRDMMRAYAALGQPEQVQGQYRNCVRALARELGIAPSAETTTLYRGMAQPPAPPDGRGNSPDIGR